MWFKDLFEAYDSSYTAYDELKSINGELQFVKSLTSDSNMPEAVIFPSDVKTLESVCYIKIINANKALHKDLYQKLMDLCTRFVNNFPNLTDDKFADELSIIQSNHYSNI